MFDPNTAPTPDPAAETPETNQTVLAKGQLVEHAWEDPTGAHTRKGVVVDVAAPSGANPERVWVAWLDVTGAMDPSALTPVAH